MFSRNHLENLRRLKRTMVPPEVLERGRTKLRAFIAAHPSVRPVQAHWWQRAFVWKPAAAVTIVAFAVGGSSIAVFASEGAMPGDSLYQIKLMAENVRAQLTASPQQRFRLGTQQVERRLDEVSKIITRTGHSSADKAARVSLAMQEYRHTVTNLNQMAAHLDSGTGTEVEAQADLAADEVERLVERQEQLVEAASGTGSTNDEIVAGVQPALVLETKMMQALNKRHGTLMQRMLDRTERLQERLKRKENASSTDEQGHEDDHEHVEVTAPATTTPLVDRPRMFLRGSFHAGFEMHADAVATSTH